MIIWPKTYLAYTSCFYSYLQSKQKIKGHTRNWSLFRIFFGALNSWCMNLDVCFERLVQYLTQRCCIPTKACVCLVCVWLRSGLIMLYGEISLPGFMRRLYQWNIFHWRNLNGVLWFHQYIVATNTAKLVLYTHVELADREPLWCTSDPRRFVSSFEKYLKLSRHSSQHVAFLSHPFLPKTSHTWLMPI